MYRIFIHRLRNTEPVIPTVQDGPDVDDHFWVTNEPDTLNGYGMETWPCTVSQQTSQYLFQDDPRMPATIMMRISDMAPSHLQQTQRLMMERNPWNPALKLVATQMQRKIGNLLELDDQREQTVEELAPRPQPFMQCVAAAAALRHTLPTMPLSEQVSLLRMLADVVAPFSNIAADELRFPDLRVFPHEVK